MNKTMHINLFANCIAVAGAKNSIICDLQRSSYFDIDMVLYQILTTHSGKTINEIIEHYGNQYEQNIIDQINQLLEYDLISLTNEKDLFPKLNMQWESPAIITNMIIEFGDYFEKKEKEILDDLTILGVKHIELRFYEEVSYEKLCSFLKALERTKVTGIYLVMLDLPTENIFKFLMDNLRVMNIILSDVEESAKGKYEQYKSKIKIVPNKILNNEGCGIICQKSFNTNIELFTESQKFNSCLNSKLTILSNGEIKNCPSVPEVLGNINNSRMTEALKHKDAYKYWFINKDQIEVCKDCEFRYICTDCRAFRSDDSNIYSKPLKCNYDPYEGKWK